MSLPHWLACPKSPIFPLEAQSEGCITSGVAFTILASTGLSVLMHLIGSFLFPPKRFELLGIGAAVLAGGGFSNLSTYAFILYRWSRLNIV